MTAKSVLFGDALGGPDPDDVTMISCWTSIRLTWKVQPNYGTYSGIYDNAVEFFELSLAEVTDYFTTLRPLQTTQPFMLASITFELSMEAPAGQALLQLMDDTFFSLAPTGGDFDVKGRTGINILTTTLRDGSVTVAVPVPGTAALMLVVGLLGLVRPRPDPMVSKPKIALGS